MQEKKFVKVFRGAKLIQLCTLLAIETVFFLILVCTPALGARIYTEKPLFILCTITWILMIFNLLCLIYDFCKLRSFAKESHALNKLAYLDHLTGLPNRHGLDTVFQTYDTPESLAQVGCAMITIDNLKMVNETCCHADGNQMIQGFCSILENVGDKFGVVGRNGGNEFIAVINNCTADTMNLFINTLKEEVDIYNTENPKLPLHLKHTYILNSEECAEAFTQLLTTTYNKLHA